MALTALGAPAIWLGFLGGAVGDYCAEELTKLGIEVVSVRTRVATRVNVELIEDSGTVTEILDPGAVPDHKEQQALLDSLREGLRSKWKGAAVVISGSLPSGMAPEYYCEIVRLARDHTSKAMLDSSGDGLRAGLSAGLDFVKINRHEAEALLACRVNNLDSAIAAAFELVERGAASAAITLGSEGLVWIESRSGPVWVARTPELHPASTVGCGDATLAGFIYGFHHGYTDEEVIRLAASCGVANCGAAAPCRLSKDDVAALRPKIAVEQRVR